MFVAGESGCAFFAFNRDRDKFVVESSSSNRPSSAGLRHQRVLILLLARDLVMLRQHFGGFAHQHLRHGTKESAPVHAVPHLLIPQPSSPPPYPLLTHPP